MPLPSLLTFACVSPGSHADPVSGNSRCKGPVAKGVDEDQSGWTTGTEGNVVKMRLGRG